MVVGTARRVHPPLCIPIVNSITNLNEGNLMARWILGTFLLVKS